MVKNALQGFDANGRPDDLLARITYDKSVYANAFLFTEVRGDRAAGKATKSSKAWGWGFGCLGF
jgi:hypothetical protein